MLVFEALEFLTPELAPELERHLPERPPYFQGAKATAPERAH